MSGLRHPVYATSSVRATTLQLKSTIRANTRRRYRCRGIARQLPTWRGLASSTTGYGSSRLDNGSHAYVDLRSDTVTTPTAAMRQAMHDAQVGDNVFDEDPTVKEIERVAIEMFEKDAALFFPTATMGNLAAIMSHCNQRGSELIVGDRQHIYLYEQGGSATLAGVHPWAIPNAADGTIPLQDIERAIRVEDVHCPVTTMVALENTHNSSGGRALPVEYIDSVGELTQRHGLKLHIDGARIMNAAVALGVSPSRLCQSADSVTICLSKGLGAPAGSLVVGTKDFIYRCKRARKALGGGMRQSGVLAAAGLVALRETTSSILQKDHERARVFADAVCEFNGISFSGAVADTVQSNIVFFNVAQCKAQELVDKLQQDHGTLMINYDESTIRAVFHHQVSDEQLERVVDAMREVTRSLFPAKDSKC